MPHNGMTENSLEGLTDSLCNDIAKYHLINGTYTIVDLAESSGSINTLLGYMVSTEVQDGYTLMNSSRIISGDNEAVNGIFHKVDEVIARSSRLIGDEMDHVEGYTIFNDALKLTGIDKLMGAGWTINEINRALGQPKNNDPDCDTRFITKNYGELRDIAEGGESDG
jgi:hypothetical protein